MNKPSTPLKPRIRTSAMHRTLAAMGLATLSSIGQAAVVPDTPLHLPYDEITDWLTNDPSPIVDIALGNCFLRASAAREIRPDLARGKGG